MQPILEELFSKMKNGSSANILKYFEMLSFSVKLYDFK